MFPHRNRNLISKMDPLRLGRIRGNDEGKDLTHEPFDTSTGVDMKRREFLRLLLLGGILSLLGRKAKAEKKNEDTNGVKEAMFWRRLDDE
jgi:hypothetical protein